ncbi:4-hydroxybutyrate dehydrogenase [Lachnospiraceae bacterium 38-10]
MKQILIRPEIQSYGTFREFAADYALDERDVILTNEYIYHPIMAAENLKCGVIYQEKFGAGEPTDIMAEAILKEVKKYDARRIIAVGGGTIIDIAKVLVLEGGKDIDDMYDKMAFLKKGKELIIVPTTCGTGSEVTNIAVLNRTKLGTKQGMVSAGMFADKAVLIPEFLGSLPYKVFATSSIDALVHAVESYLNPAASVFSEMYSVRAIEMILAGYCRIAKEGQEAWKEDAEDYLTASCMAGIAFSNNGCGAVHAMAYAIGGKYHVPHGESNYQYFVPVLRWYEKKAPGGRLDELKDILKKNMEAGGFGRTDSDESAVDLLGELLDRVLPAKKMREYGVVQEDIAPFAQSTVDNQQRLLKNSYVPFSREEIQAVYQSCL